MEPAEQIISFILNPTFSGWLLVIKIVFLVFSALFFSFIVFGLVKTSWLKKIILCDLIEVLTYRPCDLKKVRKEWSDIIRKAEEGEESSYKSAVMKANALLENVLKIMGYSGRNLGERLEKVGSIILPNIKEVKEACKVCEDIISNPDYKLDLEQTKRLLVVYKEAFRHLDVL